MAGNMKLGGGGRFAKLKGQLKARGASNPAALAAWIGRKKYGKKRFAKLSAKGKSNSSSSHRREAAKEVAKEYS